MVEADLDLDQAVLEADLDLDQAVLEPVLEGVLHQDRHKSLLLVVPAGLALGEDQQVLQDEGLPVADLEDAQDEPALYTCVDV